MLGGNATILSVAILIDLICVSFKFFHFTKLQKLIIPFVNGRRYNTIQQELWFYLLSLECIIVPAKDMETPVDLGAWEVEEERMKRGHSSNVFQADL